MPAKPLVTSGANSFVNRSTIAFRESRTATRITASGGVSINSWEIADKTEVSEKVGPIREKAKAGAAVQAIEAIRDVTRRLIEEGPTDDEIRRAVRVPGQLVQGLPPGPNHDVLTAVLERLEVPAPARIAG